MFISSLVLAATTVAKWKTVAAICTAAGTALVTSGPYLDRKYEEKKSKKKRKK